jgi:uncharacterized membrane protein
VASGLVVPEFTELVRYISFFFGVIGVAITTFGGVRAIVQIGDRWRRKVEIDLAGVKRQFIQVIILGLDFFITADILTSFITPTFDDVILLATVVGIRTVLSVFLTRETKG